MTNQWGYVDPVQRVHAQKASWNVVHWQEANQGMLYLPPPQSISGPLDGFNQAVPEILYSSGSVRQYRQGPSVVGAVIGGILGVMFGKWLERRAADREQRILDLKRSLGIEGVE